VAQLISLWLDEVDGSLWGRNALKERLTAQKMLDKLGQRVSQFKCLEAANTIFAIAIQASYDVLNLYLRERNLFDRIAPRHKLLPLLASIHPETSKITAQMLADARLGTKTDDAYRIGSKTWFVSDTPASIYARAIITSVRMNRNLEPISQQQASWAEFDRKNKVETLVLPFPKYVAGLDRIPVPITLASVMQYWRKGKEMILEEMPEFHLRPEWQKYRDRRYYKDGAKKGAIQHAIFKDILTALKTIAGSNHRRSAAKLVTKRFREIATPIFPKR
jgi:hypothetical protein